MPKIDQIQTNMSEKQKEYLKMMFKEEKILSSINELKVKEWLAFEKMKDYLELYRDAERYLRQLYWDEDERKNAKTYHHRFSEGDNWIIHPGSHLEITGQS